MDQIEINGLRVMALPWLYQRRKDDGAGIRD